MLADLQPLLATPLPATLGPGPRAGVLSESGLEEKLNLIFRGSKLSPQNQQLIRALLLLWHDHLDAAHSISQDIHTPDGSFLHGITHRREPDYGNAAYWFRRVGSHPVFPQLAARTSTLVKTRTDSALEAKLLPNGQWDPFAFIRLCEQNNHPNASDPQKSLLEEIQSLETSVLLAHFTAP